MSARLSSIVTDLSGVEYRLIIYDRDYTGSEITTFSIPRGGLTLSHEGDQSDPFKRICPTKLTWSMFLNLESYETEQIAELESFYTDISGSYEGRFYCTLRHNIFGGSVLFRGKIITDLGEISLNSPGEVKFTAVDGLSVLKDIEYRPTEYTDLVAEYAIKTYSFNSHFQQILMKSDVNQFFYEDTAFNGVADILFTTAAFWTESKSVAGDIFNQVRKRNTYFKTIGGTYRKYDNCYNALVDLLTGFNARIIFSNGIYHVEQLGYLDNLTLTRYKYDYDGNYEGIYGNKTTVNINTNDDIKLIPTPTKRVLAPFKAVELVQSKQYTNYLNGLKVSSDANPGPHNFGNVIAVGLKLVTQFRFYFKDKGTEPLWVSNANYGHKIEIEFKIKLGNYYLKIIGDNSIVEPTGKSFEPIRTAEWTLTNQTVKFITERVIKSNNQDTYNWLVFGWFSSIERPWVIESLTCPVNGELSLELIDIDYTINNIPIDLEVEFIRDSRLILAKGYNDLYEVPDDISIYEVGDIRNTIVYEIKFDYFDTTTNYVAFKQLFIKNSSYPVETFTTQWTDSDMVSTLPIQQLCMKQILGMRAKPTEVLDFTLINLSNYPLTYDMRFAFNDELYIPLTLEHNIESGEYRYNLYKVFKDYAGINIVNIPPPITEVPEYPVPDGGLDSAISGGGGGVQYYEEWTNVSTNYVTVDYVQGYVGNEYSVKTKFHFIVNGIRQKYTPGVAPNPNVQNREFDVDTSTDRIYFGKGSGNVKHVELIVYY